MTNLASCQNKEINQQGFCIQDSLIYYNGQKFEVAGPVDNFVKIAGKPDRIVTDSLGGYTIKDWMWNKKLISVNKHSHNNYYTLTTLYYDKEKNEFNDDTNHKDYLKKYKTLEEIIKKYGKFDKYTEEKEPWDVRTHYIWDKLGIDVYITPQKEINSFTLNMLHYRKIEKITQKRLKDPELVYDNTPTGEYKGLFTYNGHTVDFGKMDYDNWFKTIEGLKITGESFDPPGDSKKWSRIIYEKNLSVEMQRYTNELHSEKGYTVEELGVVNTVKMIQISN